MGAFPAASAHCHHGDPRGKVMSHPAGTSADWLLMLMTQDWLARTGHPSAGLLSNFALSEDHCHRALAEHGAALTDKWHTVSFGTKLPVS